MVRSSANRASKYDAKIVGDVIKNRIDAQRDSMVAQATSKFGELEALENGVKAVLIAAGVATILMPGYYAFARQLYKQKTNHGTNSVTTAEAQRLKVAWQGRGLASATLILVAADCGFTVT